MTDATDDDEGTFICAACVGESYLSAEIQKQGKTQPCTFCETEGHVWSIEQLADAVETAFDRHYLRTLDEPDDMEYRLMSDKESEFDWERHGEPVVQAIMGAADISEDVAKAVQAILEERHEEYDHDAIGVETAFARDSYYEEKGTDDRRWQEEWHTFQRTLKTEARFFNKSATTHLAQVFAGLDRFKTDTGKAIIVAAGPGTDLQQLYRARTFQSDEKLEAALERSSEELGSPPSALAMPGRMNARGISVFYGANQPLVALAEVRPPVGAQVAIGRFDVVRPLRLLDLSALDSIANEPGSIFDPEWSDQLERTMFLRSLSARLTRPVMPDDEALDYLATQAVAEYLAASDLNIDGIIYPSVQAQEGAFNVVLFQKAARVELRKLAPGTKVSASTGQNYEHGWEVEYSILEQTPAPKPKLPRAFPFDPFDDDLPHMWRPDGDARVVTLRLDIKAIEVHIVGHVSFQTTTYPVSHHAWQQPAPSDKAPTLPAQDIDH